MEGIDFIGDVHGRAGLLRRALQSMGYRKKNGAFQHPSRRVVFLGDILNRGPEIRATARMVRPMVDQGQALLLLGNHELFALWDYWHRQDPRRIPPLPAKCARHLAPTRLAFRANKKEWIDLLRWLENRPLFFDNGHVRAVHACWHPPSLARLARNRLSPDYFHSGTRERQALWRILEGPSVRHPATGDKFRIRWWELRASTWADFAYSSRSNLPDTPLPSRRLSQASPYPASDPPCFIGHYGFSKPCLPLLPNLACLDFAVAQGGPLGIYRWNGERRLKPENFRQQKAP